MAYECFDQHGIPESWCLREERVWRKLKKGRGQILLLSLSWLAVQRESFAGITFWRKWLAGCAVSRTTNGGCQRTSWSLTGLKQSSHSWSLENYLESQETCHTFSTFIHNAWEPPSSPCGIMSAAFQALKLYNFYAFQNTFLESSEKALWITRLKTNGGTHGEIRMGGGQAFQNQSLRLVARSSPMVLSWRDNSGSVNAWQIHKGFYITLGIGQRALENL